MSKLQVFIFISVLSLVALCSNISIPATSDTAPPFARPLFVDEFDEGVLEPGWEWTDPGNDSAKRFGAKAGWLEIATTAGNDLWPNANLDAPRLLRSISGDFAIETKLAPPPDRTPQAGGILVWKDEGNFIRFERGTWGHDTVILQKREGDLFQHLGDWFFRGNPLYLRLERRGEKFKALYSVNGEGWNECSQFTFEVNDPLRVGMHVVCLGSRTPSTATNFDYFKMFWTGENEPYTASNVGAPEDEELQIRQEAENEKLTERASYVLSKTASERRADSEDVMIEPRTGLKFTKIYSDEKLDVIGNFRQGLSISPDGKFLFAHKDGWVIPLKEGQDPFELVPEIAGLVREIGGVIHGSWSPNMRKFAFVPSQTGELFVVPISPETGRATGPAKKLVDKSASHSSVSWSPDGKLLAFSWEKSGNLDIWTIPATGGEPTQITNDARSELWPVWSPDGKSIAFIKKRDLTEDKIGDVWIIPAEGGTAEKIVDDVRLPLRFSPDGRWLACRRIVEVNGIRDFFLRLSDKHKVGIVPPENGGCLFGRFYRGNKMLFYKAGRIYRSTLKVVPVYGGPSVELGKGLELRAYLQNWSPDGKVLLISAPVDTWFRIIPVAGGTPTVLEKLETDLKLKWIPSLPFSPDLKRLAFLTEDRSLWIFPFSIEERRTTGPAVKMAEKIVWNRSICYVGWSPDSKRIAFSSRKSGNADIWTASVEGDELKRLTDEPEDETWPVWSPDGEMIAYHKENGIWVVPVSGGEPREIAKGGWCYTWSPDGKELAFMDSIGATCISIMALATGEMRQINIPNAWWNLIWSPDGSKLAFLSYTKEKGPQIWVVPATGGEPAELASDDPGDKFFLYWSPDGRKLSYNSSRYVKVGMGAIWEADVGELLSGAEREQ